MSSLPVILVSAKTEDAASNIISELIEGEPPAETCSEGGEGARVWRIQNKYYTADVRLVGCADGVPPPDLPHPPQGHVIYLAHDECVETVMASRLSAGAEAEVRVLAADTECLPPALEASAARARLEPVALRARGGLAEARAALHAHAWPGLVRARAGPGAKAQEEEEGSETDMERWAAALGALGPAAGAVRALAGAERLAAAEHVLAAFCHALGEDIDTL